MKQFLPHQRIVLRAELASLLSMCRLMDDIAGVGMPASVDVSACREMSAIQGAVIAPALHI
jgi:hypothetical protein